MRVFSQMPIVMTLTPYVDIEGWFSLAAMNSYMYSDWTSSKCIDAIDMRALVEERFGWTYAKANPFDFVRKIMFENRLPFRVKPKKFRCTAGCGRTRGNSHLISHRLTVYATCDECFNPDDSVDIVYADNAPDVHFNIMCDLLAESVKQQKSTDPINFLSSMKPFHIASIASRHYQEGKAVTRTKEYHDGGILVASVDAIRKRAREDVDECLIGLYTDWLENRIDKKFLQTKP